MARKRRKVDHKGRREKRVIDDSKRRESLFVPRDIKSDVIAFTDDWRARKRKIYIHAHPIRKVTGLAGYGFRNAWRHHEKQEKLRRKRRDRRQREPGLRDDVYDKEALRIRDKRVCKRRVARRIALFALGKAGFGKSVRAYRRWNRDSYVDCR